MILFRNKTKALEQRLESLLNENAELKERNTALENITRADRSTINNLKTRCKKQQEIIDMLNKRLGISRHEP